MTTVRTDEQGAISIPPDLLREVGIEPCQPVLVEKVGRFLRIYGAAQDVELYTPERKAEFLLNSAVDQADYAEIRKEVIAMGLDPAKIAHAPPSGI